MLRNYHVFIFFMIKEVSGEIYDKKGKICCEKGLFQLFGTHCCFWGALARVHINDNTRVILFISGPGCTIKLQNKRTKLRVGKTAKENSRKHMLHPRKAKRKHKRTETMNMMQKVVYFVHLPHKMFAKH